MAGKLTAAFVKSARHSGRTGRPEKHYDVHGLFLQVMPSRSKQIVQRLVVAGKRSDYGLGGYPIISIAEAREAAWENRRAARRGEIPQIEARPPGDRRPLRRRGAARRREPRGPTFAAAFEQVSTTRAPSWKESVRASSVRSWRAVGPDVRADGVDRGALGRGAAGPVGGGRLSAAQAGNQAFFLREVSPCALRPRAMRSLAGRFNSRIGGRPRGCRRRRCGFLRLGSGWPGPAGRPARRSRPGSRPAVPRRPCRGCRPAA